jgi:hypothetical protein
MEGKPGFGFVQVPSTSGFPEADFNLRDLLGETPLGNVIKLRHHLIFSRKERRKQSREEDICALFPYASWREFSLT